LDRLGANLSDSEDVKKVIAKQPWKKSVKQLAVCAYDLMTKKILKITWDKPKYTPEETTPFVPDEKELDQLIAACKSRRMATFLQTLKETYADPGEILKLRWIDVDSSNCVITINVPVKGHKSGQIKVSTRVIAMLNSLSNKKSEYIFPTRYDIIQNCFDYVRKRAAQRLQNPRLLKISFRTFRHWGGTMLAHYTHGQVLTVQRLLRHKNINNTMKYIHMIAFKDDEFETATATNVEEAQRLATAGFEKFDEFQGVHIYKRPKRFGG
jgi:integrase